MEVPKYTPKTDDKVKKKEPVEYKEVLKDVVHVKDVELFEKEIDFLRGNDATFTIFTLKVVKHPILVKKQRHINDNECRNN